MADAKPSRPTKQSDVDPDAYQPKEGEKIVTKNGRKYIEKQVQGKTVRMFLDGKRA